jgi:NAD(P)-dependent dehydrogenase (short-subunit alcohol dehydrogenase family)
MIIMRLANRTAVVTGAGSGIGRAIARRFGAEGARVIVSDVREEPIWAPSDDDRPTAQAIAEAGGEAEFVQTDVASWQSVDALVSHVAERYGRLDIVVTSAATFESTNILDTSEENWDTVMSVNLKGTFLTCKRAIGQMMQQDLVNDVRGRVIMISSQHGMIGPPNYFAYAVSKGGTVQMTRQLAVDYGRHGVIVNAVAPGRIITGTHPGEVDLSDPEIPYSESRTPFSRLGRAEDCAGAALYLASDDCTYVSGVNLLVDGGWMAY